MVSRAKYKRVPDLYTVGTEVVLKDGTVMWLQVPNPFQYDECRHDASVARARLVLALKEDGEELAKLKGAFYEEGLEQARQTLVDAQAGKFLMKAFDAIRIDPDWRERMEILDRSSDLLARPEEESERKLLQKIAEDYHEELQRRVQEETEFLTGQYDRMSEDELWAEYRDWYVERRGGDLAEAEYRLTEIWYATRCCDGVQADGEWDHAACDGHQVQVYESKAEVKSLPQELQVLLRDALQAISLTEVEAKNLARLARSSVSSRQPSEEGESTPSIPTEIPAELPGPSSSP